MKSIFSGMRRLSLVPEVTWETVTFAFIYFIFYVIVFFYIKPHTFDVIV